MENLLLQSDELPGVGLTVLDLFCDLDEEIEDVFIFLLKFFQVATYKLWRVRKKLTYFAKVLGLDVSEFRFLDRGALWNFVNFV